MILLHTVSVHPALPTKALAKELAFRIKRDVPVFASACGLSGCSDFVVYRRLPTLV
jgi:hypothetical protein